MHHSLVARAPFFVLHHTNTNTNNIPSLSSPIQYSWCGASLANQVTSTYIVLYLGKHVCFHESSKTPCNHCISASPGTSFHLSASFPVYSKHCCFITRHHQKSNPWKEKRRGDITLRLCTCGRKSHRVRGGTPVWDPWWCMSDVSSTSQVACK